MILEACNRTVLKLHHADFKYTEGILSHWNEQNVRTLQGVEQSDLHYAQTKEQKEKKKPSTSGKQTPRNQFQNFKQRDVSSEELQELERKLLMLEYDLMTDRSTYLHAATRRRRHGNIQHTISRYHVSI